MFFFFFFDSISDELKDFNHKLSCLLPDLSAEEIEQVHTRAVAAAKMCELYR